MAERKGSTYNRKHSSYRRKPAEKRPYTPPPVRSYAALTPKVKRGDIFFFTAPSLRVPGKVNTVAYCPTDDTSHCDCFAAEYVRACWHVRHVRMAWLVRMARNAIRDYSNEELGRVEREAAAMLKAGIDAERFQAVYSAVGDEWAARLVRFPAPDGEPDPTPPAAPALVALPRAVPLHELASTGTEGYRPAPPPARSWPGGANTDVGVCRDASCERCGHRGLEYRPYFRQEPRSYRAFAVCPACGHAAEF
jgi:hypothetical protein